jgi:DNA-binding NarL/FixJ family response regulator
MAQSPNNTPGGVANTIWVDCPHSVVTAGLVRALEGEARVHIGSEPPPRDYSAIIFCSDDSQSLLESIKRFRDLSPDTVPILVLGSHLELPLARAAIRAGASGFVHAEMTPGQVVRAVKVAIKGELVAPRELIRYLIVEPEPANANLLSARQREILELVVEGLSNAEIAKQLFLSESTVKQHLRAVYKLLKVSNRTEAANLFRHSDGELT